MEITQIELIPPSSLFDSIEITGDLDFTDLHSLKSPSGAQRPLKIVDSNVFLHAIL